MEHRLISACGYWKRGRVGCARNVGVSGGINGNIHADFASIAEVCRIGQNRIDDEGLGLVVGGNFEMNAFIARKNVLAVYGPTSGGQRFAVGLVNDRLVKTDWTGRSGQQQVTCDVNPQVLFA